MDTRSELLVTVHSDGTLHGAQILVLALSSTTDVTDGQSVSRCDVGFRLLYTTNFFFRDVVDFEAQFVDIPIEEGRSLSLQPEPSSSRHQCSRLSG
jgi:hypothetical protein